MKVKTLTLSNYRNYNQLDLAFTHHLNLMIGNNAQGKTNILESIYVLALTKSYRTHQDKDLIREGQDTAILRATVDKQTGTVPLSLRFTKKGKKARVNHLDQSKLSHYIGQLNVVMFSPEELSLVKGSPQQRRRFMDIEIGQIRPTYIQHLSQYQHIVRQRNAYLKHQAVHHATHTIQSMLDVYDQQLVRYGAPIIEARIQFVALLEQIARPCHHNMSLGQEQLSLHYDTTLLLDDIHSLEDIQQQLMQQLLDARDKDIKQKTTTIGPHRDDMLIAINQKNIQQFGSQGQQRLAVLSLKLAETELMKQELGEYPILLLDDVMSELDNQRQIKLMETINSSMQTFMTTTTLDHLHLDSTLTPAIFTVNNGCIEERK